VPVADPQAVRSVIRVAGDLPSPLHPPQGCHFHPRCSAALPQCATQFPDERTFSASHATRCHLYEKG
jgi:peptide/nickel transport system ATP-binding protein